MTALPGILMLVQACPVKVGKSVCVSWKMRRHPVQDHTDTGLMHLIHEEHKIFRIAVTRCGGIIADHLISPGSIQRMLHDRHQLNMRIAHLLYILYNLRYEFPIIIIFPSVVRFCKRCQIDLVYIDRLVL